MPLQIDDLQRLTPFEKAELYNALGTDKALNDYLYADNRIFDELTCRDQEVAAGKMQLLTREELSKSLEKSSSDLEHQCPTLNMSNTH